MCRNRQPFNSFPISNIGWKGKTIIFLVVLILGVLTLNNIRNPEPVNGRYTVEKWEMNTNWGNPQDTTIVRNNGDSTVMDTNLYRVPSSDRFIIESDGRIYWGSGGTETNKYSDDNRSMPTSHSFPHDMLMQNVHIPAMNR